MDHAARSFNGGDLVEGARVRLDGLLTRPELNGLTGTLVARHDNEKWHVRLDDNCGDKVLKAKNLIVEKAAFGWKSGGGGGSGSGGGASFGRQAPERDMPSAASSRGGAGVNAGPGRPTPQRDVPTSARDYPQRDVPSSSSARDYPGAKAASRPAPQRQVPSATNGRGSLGGYLGREEKKAPLAPKRAEDIQLETHHYKVVHKAVFIRDGPSLTDKVAGMKKEGDHVIATEETFDGWIHLKSEGGWMVKDMHGRDKVGKVLSSVGSKPTLARPDPHHAPCTAIFEVMFNPQIAIRQAPSKSALLVGVKKQGEQVNADLQTYGGWVRIQEGQWLLTRDPTHGELLRFKRYGLPMQQIQQQQQLQQQQQQQFQQQHQPPNQQYSQQHAPQGSKQQEERQRLQAIAARELEQQQANRARAEAALATAQKSIASNNTEEMKREISNALAAGVPKASLGQVEAAMTKLCNFQQRLEKARKSENELRACIDEGSKLGYTRETQMARSLLEECLATQNKHSGLLERLAAAARSGDPAEIKASREAAKQGGVDKKEIARIFSLNAVQDSGPRLTPAPAAPPATESAAASCDFERSSSTPQPDDVNPTVETERPEELKTTSEQIGRPFHSAQSVDSTNAESAASNRADCTELKAGAAVRISGLSKKPELNGLTGVIVAAQEDKWKVILDTGGMKLFKADNLTLYDKLNAPDSAAFDSLSTSASTQVPAEPTTTSDSANASLELQAEEVPETAAAHQDEPMDLRSELLDRLAAAARSGDPKEIKASRDAAKKGGIETKDIARIFSLNAVRDAATPASSVAPASTEPSPEPTAEAREQSSAGQDVAPDSVEGDEQTAEEEEAGKLDGYWTGVDGELMAKIDGSTIHWADGPAVELVWLSENSVSCDMSAYGAEELFTAELDAEGKLRWNDGDVWSR
eukprot:TRINITY_DN1626_c0_g2_i3.p1 TRINITY_DN1626_c0_g2~~TRINITY_DN1626_c0_g2_i3.p1  ORF type:complete len:1056 (-),score=219.24 TRINITY_DN1626_c0_g2_i3:150-2924(-)